MLKAKKFKPGEYDRNTNIVPDDEALFEIAEEVSNCCSARITEDGLCSDCKDHCVPILINEDGEEIDSEETCGAMDRF